MAGAGATLLILMLVLAGCEKGVKPAGAPAPKAATTVKKTSIDQTPELEGHPRALYHEQRLSLGQETEWFNEWIELVRLQPGEMQRTLLAPEPAPKDGFIATANRVCPVMQKMGLNETTAVEHAVEFEGKVVGLCCADCLDAWVAMTDDERRERLKTVMDKK